MVTIDAASANIIHRTRVDLRFYAVYQASIGQGVACVDLGGVGRNFTCDGVVNVIGRQVERIASLKLSVVGDVACGREGGVAVGDDLATVGEVSVQGEVQVAFGAPKAT